MKILVICTEKNCYWNLSLKEHWWEFWKKDACIHKEPKLNLAGTCASCYTYISRLEAQRRLSEIGVSPLGVSEQK
jgi:hypothetical protein